MAKNQKITIFTQNIDEDNVMKKAKDGVKVKAALGSKSTQDDVKNYLDEKSGKKYDK